MMRTEAMKMQVHWDRRSGIDRRVFCSDSNSERRGGPDRRSSGSDRYVLVVSGHGVDSFTLMVMMPIAALSAIALFDFLMV
jgi:hypothetical protein